ncbi:hypothetical protein V5738_08040 [Salinisphaera sp. SPP-AMP-43]|uniref:COG4648 family protein n=1 Tax=Salinisphaera sp. SPP-AMP-43 TaxID=3121288 RepID=UPI003C6DCE62
MRLVSLLTACVPLLYPVLVHAAVVTESSGLRFAALSVLILNVAAPWLAQRRLWAWIGVPVAMSAAAILADSIGARAFFYATPILICLALAWLFGHTLRAGRTPLISRLATAIRGPLPAPVARYTRAVTVFWFGVMLAMAGADLLLALFAPPALWSLFANGVNFLLMAGLFVLEWFWRQWRIGEYEHLGWRAYLAALGRIDYRRILHG